MSKAIIRTHQQLRMGEEIALLSVKPPGSVASGPPTIRYTVRRRNSQDQTEAHLGARWKVPGHQLWRGYDRDKRTPHGKSLLCSLVSTGSQDPDPHCPCALIILLIFRLSIAVSEAHGI
jgi:hypothetical protein